MPARAGLPARATIRAGSGGAVVEMNSVARRGRHAVFRYGRLMTWLASGALIVVLSSYVALPLALSSYVPQLAAQHGLRLHVEQVRIEPLEARILFSGVRAETAGGLPSEWSGIEAQVDLAALLSGRIALGSLRLSGAKLFAGEPWTGEAGAIPAVPTALLEKVSVGELVVDGAELVTISETLGHPVRIDRLRVESLDDALRPQGAAVQADVSIGEGRSTFHGRLAVNAADWTLDTGIKASDVPLDGFPAPGGLDGALRGRLDGSGPLRFVYSPATGAFGLTTGGRWAIEGLKIELPDAVVSETRAEWDGAAFMAFTGDAVVETLGIDAELRLQALDVDAGDTLRVEAAALALRVAASQTPGARRLSVEGSSPEVRFSGKFSSKGSPFEAIDVEARNVASRATLTFGGGLGVEIDRLASGALTAKLPAGRSIDVERLVIEGLATESDADVVSVAAATAERVEWQGFATAQGHGTAARVAVQELERHAGGELRFALARIGHVDVETGGTSYTLQRLALVDATDDEGRGGARIARIGAFEHRFGGNRIVFEELVAASPAWREGEESSEAIEAASLTLDTADGRRWRSEGWSLGGAETAAPALPEEGQEAFTFEAPPRGEAGAPGYDFGGLVIRGIANTVRETAGALPKAG